MSREAAASKKSSVPDSLSDVDMAAFKRFARDAAGIELNDSKRSMIYTRFVRRLRALGLSSFSEYLALLENKRSAEYESFVNTITTNLTYFFREPHHFDFLRDTVIPDVFRKPASHSPVRLWSAGCSSGEEPYSIAITLAEAEKCGGTDYRLLCTDIDSDMVAATQAGVFASAHVRGLAVSHQSTWFDKQNDGTITSGKTLRNGMICKQLNLFDTWPIRPGVDIIFCRNVLIYFDKQYQEQLINSFASVQPPGSYLFLGHSESLRGFDAVYQRVSNTVYRRI